MHKVATLKNPRKVTQKKKTKPCVFPPYPSHIPRHTSTYSRHIPPSKKLIKKTLIGHLFSVLDTNPGVFGEVDVQEVFVLGRCYQNFGHYTL